MSISNSTTKETPKSSIERSKLFSNVNRSNMGASNNLHHQKLNKSLSDTDLIVDDTMKSKIQTSGKDGIIGGGSVNSVPETISSTNDNENNDNRSNCAIM